MGPAFAGVGVLFTVTVTLEEEFKQGAFTILHFKTLIPKASPVTFVVGDNEFVITPAPETKVQLPTPTVAALAAISVPGLLIQSV